MKRFLCSILLTLLDLICVYMFLFSGERKHCQVHLGSEGSGQNSGSSRSLKCQKIKPQLIVPTFSLQNKLFAPEGLSVQYLPSTGGKINASVIHLKLATLCFYFPPHLICQCERCDMFDSSSYLNSCCITAFSEVLQTFDQNEILSYS